MTSHGSLERLTVSSLQIGYEESTAHEAMNTKMNELVFKEAEKKQEVVPYTPSINTALP